MGTASSHVNMWWLNVKVHAMHTKLCNRQQLHACICNCTAQKFFCQICTHDSRKCLCHYYLPIAISLGPLFVCSHSSQIISEPRDMAVGRI